MKDEKSIKIPFLFILHPSAFILSVEGVSMRTIIPSPWARGAGLLALMLCGSAPVRGAESEKAAGAARCVSDEILLLRREAEGQPWRVVSANEDLRHGELLVGGTGAAQRLRNGAVSQ